LRYAIAHYARQDHDKLIEQSWSDTLNWPKGGQCFDIGESALIR